MEQHLWLSEAEISSSTLGPKLKALFVSAQQLGGQEEGLHILPHSSDENKTLQQSWQLLGKHSEWLRLRQGEQERNLANCSTWRFHGPQILLHTLRHTALHATALTTLDSHNRARLQEMSWTLVYTNHAAVSQPAQISRVLGRTNKDLAQDS